jgi:hypothetical protein
LHIFIVSAHEVDTPFSRLFSEYSYSLAFQLSLPDCVIISLDL